MIRYRGSAADFRHDLERFVRVLTGVEPDYSGQVDVVKEEMAQALLGKLHAAYETKKTGGVDELGIKWPELAESTIKRKGHAIIMVEESELLDSLKPGASHPDQILKLGPGWFEVGSERSTPGGIPLISIHAKGSSRLPIRRVLPDMDLPESWIEAMGQPLIEAVASEGFWRAFLGSKAA